MKRVPYRTPKKSRGTTVEGRKAHRWKSGTVAEREIKRMQKRTDLLIPHAPFCAAVRSIAEDYCSGMRFQAEALLALHEDAEAYLTEYFAEAYKLAALEKCVTLMPRHTRAIADLQAAKGEAKR